MDRAAAESEDAGGGGDHQGDGGEAGGDSEVMQGLPLPLQHPADSDHGDLHQGLHQLGQVLDVSAGH